MGKKIMELLQAGIRSVTSEAADCAKKAVGKAADDIASAAQLSPSQAAAIEARRKEYLQEKGGNLSMEELGAIGVEVFHAYLPQIAQCYCPIQANLDEFRPENRILWFDINKWVVDASEQSIDKLTNVYQALAGENCTIALVYTRKQNGCRVTLAVANIRDSDQPTIASGLCSRLQSAIRGNFPGAELGERKNGVPDCLQTLPEECAIAAVSNLASEKSDHFISQSMEKLLDGILPQSKDEEYTILLLAQPSHSQEEALCRLYKRYSQLSPFASWQENGGYSDTLSINASANAGTDAGIDAAFANFGVNFSRSASMSKYATISKGVTASYTNFAVSHTLELIKQQVKRLEQCNAMGMWDFAAYVLSQDYGTVDNVAHMYLSLTQGEQSYLERAAVNLWSSRKAEPIRRWLNHLRHPEFALNPDLDETWLMYPTPITVTTPLSGSELAHALNFPQKSVSGLPVYECVPFGREVVQYSVDPGAKRIRLGSIYHMRRAEQAPVCLDRDSLASHVFITGSTGAGKSTAIYTILKELCLKENAEKGDATRFLVIEPAKGEYKSILGGYDGVHVYGTNPGLSQMMRLNPFSFPPEVHVLEHIDRLIEIFNACWPMYAAMPAVLKAAVERAYLICGWSLNTSKCPCAWFPTFQDVARELPAVVDSKHFSKDTQGDYKGALLTRIESLTNGINGQVLCSEEELSDQELFDENVIVDLSQVGSPETKALLMGILVLKLQEHRMAQRARESHRDNQKLHHVTVLEEAHNLLRRTSIQQSPESSNLQGKSVEMLTNAIAEMRTYGEGFVIADQAPSLLDMAAIRNTNTKIILRLPDESDRQLVGRAAGLNEDQIAELAKLDTGVAAVYQNHWLEPVLCRVDQFLEKDEHPYVPQPLRQTSSQEADLIFTRVLQGVKDDTELSQEETDRLKKWIDRLDLGSKQKRILRRAVLGKEPLSEEDKESLLYCAAKGRILCAQADHIADTAFLPAVANQQIMDQLHVSEIIAEDIRTVVVSYLNHLQKGEGKYRNLMDDEGVKTW